MVEMSGVSPKRQNLGWHLPIAEIALRSCIYLDHGTLTADAVSMSVFARLKHPSDVNLHVMFRL